MLHESGKPPEPDRQQTPAGKADQKLKPPPAGSHEERLATARVVGYLDAPCLTCSQIERALIAHLDWEC